MAQKIQDWLQGRTSIFCLAFFITGTLFQAIGKLDATYISFMVALLGSVIGHHAVTSRNAKASDTAKQISDLATRHLPHVHNALGEIQTKLNGGKSE